MGSQSSRRRRHPEAVSASGVSPRPPFAQQPCNAPHPSPIHPVLLMWLLWIVSRAPACRSVLTTDLPWLPISPPRPRHPSYYYPPSGPGKHARWIWTTWIWIQKREGREGKGQQRGIQEHDRRWWCGGGDSITRALPPSPDSQPPPPRQCASSKGSSNLLGICSLEDITNPNSEEEGAVDGLSTKITIVEILTFGKLNNFFREKLEGVVVHFFYLCR